MTREELIEKFAEEVCDTEWQRERVKYLLKYYFEHEKQYFPTIDQKYYYGMGAKFIFLDDLETNKQREKKEHWAIKEWEKMKNRHKGESKFFVSKGFTVSADMFKIESEENNAKNQG